MRSRRRITAYPAAFVCHPSRPKSSRYTLGPTNARARRHFNNADLHAHYRRPSKNGIREFPPPLTPEIAETRPTALQVARRFDIIGNLLTGSKCAYWQLIIWNARVVEWLMAPGCKPGRREPYVGSNPTPCTILIFWAGVAQLVERQPSKLNVASSSLVSRSKVSFDISPE